MLGCSSGREGEPFVRTVSKELECNELRGISLFSTLLKL